MFFKKKIKKIAVSVFNVMFGCTHFFKTLCLLHANSKKCLRPLGILLLDEETHMYNILFRIVLSLKRTKNKISLFPNEPLSLLKTES